MVVIALAQPTKELVECSLGGRMKALIFRLCLSLFTLQLGLGHAHAKDIKVLSVREVGVSTVWDLYMTVDDEMKATGLRLFDNDDKSWKNFDTSNLVKGVVLKKQSGYDVIVLKSNDFEKDRGGHFSVNYLSNGLTGSRKDFPIKIDFDGTNWEVFHAGTSISKLDFHIKKILGQTVGIKKVIAHE
jgi:hypothetical protein